MEEQLHVWENGQWSPQQVVAPARILAADSWRQGSGEVPGLELHRQRFQRALRVQSPDLLSSFDDFWGAGLRIIRAAYSSFDLFPRIGIEVLAGQTHTRLVLRIRKAPPSREITRLYLPSEDDPRWMPQVKGPDIAGLTKFKTESSEKSRTIFSGSGEISADDVVLHQENQVLEASTGALVLWVDGQLVFPTFEGHILDSTTAQLVSERAQRLGICQWHRSVQLEELMEPSLPLWFLNALHGISPVPEIYAHTGKLVRKIEHPDIIDWRHWWSQNYR